MANVAGNDAGVYVRCSMDRNDAASVTDQAETGLARCATEGWRPRLYDKDNDRSASRYAKKDREDWYRLLADLRAGLLAVVWLWESSRGDRKLYEWVGFLELCRDRGVRIYVETHGRLYDPRNARDMKTLAEDGVANAYASEETSLRVKRTLASNARKGIPNGKVHYGYVRLFDEKTGKYAAQRPEPPESEIAAGIITRIARHVPLYAIEQELKAAAVPPPNGKAWCTATLRYMARNPAYAGRRKTADGRLIEAWPAVVTLETHLSAVAVLASSARSTHNGDPAYRPGRQRHMLSYLATCDACGSILQVQKGYRDALRYSCRAHGCVFVDIAWLDELVTLAVCSALSQPDAASLYRSDGEEAARLRGEAVLLRAQLDGWLKAAVTPHEYQVKKDQLLPQIEQAEEAAAAAELPLVLRDLLAADNVRAAWDHLDIPARRAVIRALMGVSVARAGNQARAARTDPARVLIDWRRS